MFDPCSDSQLEVKFYPKELRGELETVAYVVPVSISISSSMSIAMYLSFSMVMSPSSLLERV
jgi:hypothetical protein